MHLLGPGGMALYDFRNPQQEQPGRVHARLRTEGNGLHLGEITSTALR